MEPTFIQATTGFDWYSLITTVLTIIFGGGFIASIVTLRAQRKKADAEAKGADATAESTELDNVTKAITIWRESAEKSEQRAQAAEARSQTIYESYSKLADEVSQLRAEVKKLTCTNVKILKILDSINHDNLEQKKQEAKDITGA